MNRAYFTDPSDLTFKCDATITLTPQKIAELYWLMCDHDQAKFWNHLGIISTHKLCLQSCYMSRSEELQPCGKDAIVTLSEHFRD